MKNSIILLLLLFVLIIGGCAAQQAQTTPTQTQTQDPTTNNQPGNPSTSGNLGIKKDIEISGFAFSPQTVTIPIGATVIWTNKDSAAHTIVSDSDSELNSDSIPQGGTYAHTFTTTGTYDYHCGIHPSMKGIIIVE